MLYCKWDKKPHLFSIKMTSQTQCTIIIALKINSVYLRELRVASAGSAQRSVVNIKSKCGNLSRFEYKTATFANHYEQAKK